MNQRIIALLLFAICLPLATTAQNTDNAPIAKLPEGSTPAFRLRMFALPQAAADAILSKPELKSDARSVLLQLEKMVSEKQARIFANPFVQTKGGTRAKIQSALLVFELEPVFYPDLTCEAPFSCEIQGGGKLTGNPRFSRGQPVFIGTVEPPSSGSSAPETCLVFIMFQ